MKQTYVVIYSDKYNTYNIYVKGGVLLVACTDKKVAIEHAESLGYVGGYLV